MIAWLTPNRVAVIFGILTGIAAFIAGLVKVLPTKYSDTILAIAGLITTLATLLKFIGGAQKFESTPMGQATEAKRVGLATTQYIPDNISPGDELNQGPDLNDAPERTRVISPEVPK
jgi:hypothetical protein